uniref:Uncharacterized protein n=1 Tax=Chromera velia CCMP2878 TaxID=1169474 RepID=A0A0G4GJ11_9ALVE|mmetsp:Transcript_46704/g.92213  ORF Transcript_46704/g.92213 Transcript_46704/m.92213 type:complete len:549 (-) Transcript_46704:1936-3582(-)|eukprot:Cvel_4782.t1-p1 / transcript=Cvel_4782.t1 / gene=Cvel_4782 / organism=Chromera_velia_CCMP2878 / gene_product=hypothetical protein / transcript_product=hypothetical protein / location=Cvel_scaffold213:108221-110202(-) / protein_length=548 / sequence_SO=supercontig / SO=protein_coding / is_pseudo=false
MSSSTHISTKNTFLSFRPRIWREEDADSAEAHVSLPPYTVRRAKSVPAIPVAVALNEKGGRVPTVEGEPSFLETLCNVGSLEHRGSGCCQLKRCFWAHSKHGCRKGWTCFACHYCNPPPVTAEVRAHRNKVRNIARKMRKRAARERHSAMDGYEAGASSTTSETSDRHTPKDGMSPLCESKSKCGSIRTPSQDAFGFRPEGTSTRVRAPPVELIAATAAEEEKQRHTLPHCHQWQTQRLEQMTASTSLTGPSGCRRQFSRENSVVSNTMSHPDGVCRHSLLSLQSGPGLVSAAAGLLPTPWHSMGDRRMTSVPAPSPHMEQRELEREHRAATVQIPCDSYPGFTMPHPSPRTRQLSENPRLSEYPHSPASVSLPGEQPRCHRADLLKRRLKLKEEVTPPVPFAGEAQPPPMLGERVFPRPSPLAVPPACVNQKMGQALVEGRRGHFPPMTDPPTHAPHALPSNSAANKLGSYVLASEGFGGDGSRRFSSPSAQFPGRFRPGECGRRRSPRSHCAGGTSDCWGQILRGWIRSDRKAALESLMLCVKRGV